MASPRSERRRRPAALVALGGVLLVEALGVAVVAAFVAVATVGGTDPASGVAAALTVLLVAALLVVVAVGVFRARPWTRAATFVWQVVQLLVGAYAFQGAGAAVGFGVAAVVPAVLALVLLFTRPVRDATRRP